MHADDNRLSGDGRAVSGSADVGGIMGDINAQPATMSYLDTLYSNIDVAAINAELRSGQALMAEGNAEMRRGEAKVNEGRRKTASAEATLAAYRAWQIASGQISEDDEPLPRADRPGALGGSHSPTGRASVLALIENGADTAEWTIPTLADALGVGPESHHAIGVSVQRLARDARIRRVRKGFYTKLLSPNDSPGGEEEREMRLSAVSQFGTG
jgi:hypothetical protein